MKHKARSHHVLREVRTDLETHPAAVAWCGLRGSGGVPTTIEVLKERIEHDGALKAAVYRLRLVDGPAHTIIAKRCKTRVAEKESFLYRNVLPRVPITVLACHGIFTEPESRYSWLFLEDAGSTPVAKDSDEHRALRGSWLARLHAGARHLDLGGHLPAREASFYRTCVNAARQAIERHIETGKWQRDQLDVLQEILALFAEVDNDWDFVTKTCEYAPATLVHGDFVGKNMCFSRDGDTPDLILFDWQTAGWGPPAADLASGFGRNASEVFLDAYHEEILPHFPLSMDQVRELTRIGKLFRTLVAIQWDAGWIEWSQPDTMVHRMRAHRDRLHLYLGTASS